MELRDVINKIDSNQLFVPAFQREYVWKRENAKDLIRSLLKKYPTGTMLTWETNNPPELKGTFEYNETQGSVKLILDGQQRITTLYMLIKGEIPPYYTEKEITNNIFDMYINIETLELEYYIKNRMENNPSWINLTSVFRSEVNPRDVTDDIARRDEIERLPREKEDTVYNNIRAIEQIKERDFLEQEVPSAASLKEAIDIFYIVNASGVNLTDAELALAQISGYWPQAREIFKKKLHELEERGWVFKLDFIVYLLLGIQHKIGSKMEKLHTQADNEDLKEIWRNLDEKVLDYACSLLQSHAYVDHSSEINSVYAMVPLIAYIYNKPNWKLDEQEIELTVKWFYYSQLRQRYISQLAQKLDKDLRIINESQSPFDELLANIEEERSLEIKPSELEGRGISHPFFSLIRWYFKSQGAICLGTGLQLQKNMGKAYALERDHIFAYSILRDSEHYDMSNRWDYAAAQEITNRMILTQVENRTKSAKSADTYLSQVKERFPNALRLQCIPENPELWKTENFKDFLATRREILADKLNEFLNNLSISSRDFSPTISISDLIEQGESSLLEFKSTMRWNVRESKVDKKMEENILKSIAAFSNTDGGTLLVGVSEDVDGNGQVYGLIDDYNTLNKSNRDGFELHLRNLVNNSYGKGFATTQLDVRFHTLDDLDICEVQIKRGTDPVYTKISITNAPPQKKFFVRSGNSSQFLEIDEATNYSSERFSS